MTQLSDSVLDYEIGRLLACMGDKDGSLKHFDLVLSGISLPLIFGRQLILP
jgi:hypothetical protein